LPLRTVTVDGPPFSVPRYLHLDLGRQTQRSVACFRLHSHALRVKTRSWEHHDDTCDTITLSHLVSVACRQFKMKNTLFSCAVAHKCVRWGFDLQTCFTIYLWLTKLLSIRMELFISLKLFLKMSSIFSRNKLMIPIALFQSLWMLFWWLVFTSNLISQTTWLKVKLKLVYPQESCISVSSRRFPGI